MNAVHDQGQALAALEPSRIEVGSDGRCDVSAAHKGSPAPEYLAPDRRESGESSTIADVYAAGVIAWELLVGRTPGPSPAHVAEVRPEVPREVADAVMACLERTPDWRPKDLTYLAQIAAAKQPAAGRAPAPPRANRPGRSSARASARASDDRPARRMWPLAALVIVAALAGLAWWQFIRPGSSASVPGRAPGPVAPTPVAVADATPAPETVATPAPRVTATPVPVSTPGPTERESAGPVPTPVPTVPPPRATPTPTPTPTPPPPADTEAGTPPVNSPPPPAVTPTADIPPVAPPAVPAELTAVSPLTVSRGTKALLDVRGTSLRATHRVQIVPLKKAPAGITVVRQKLVSDVLITVLLDLTSKVSPGEYGVVVEEPQGTRSNTLIFTVAR